MSDKFIQSLIKIGSYGTKREGVVDLVECLGLDPLLYIYNNVIEWCLWYGMMLGVIHDVVWLCGLFFGFVLLIRVFKLLPYLDELDNAPEAT